MTLFVISDRHASHIRLPWMDADQTEGHQGLFFNTHFSESCSVVMKSLCMTIWLHMHNKKLTDLRCCIFFSVFVGSTILPQSIGSSFHSEWRSIRLFQSKSQWLQRLSGWKQRLSRSWSSTNWCSRSYPPESTVPPPTRPLQPAETQHATCQESCIS